MLANSKCSISQNDQKVLNILLGNDAMVPHVKTRIDTNMPPDQHITEMSVLEELVDVEKQAILLQKSGQLDKSLQLLNSVIRRYPKYASAYNNRAQLLRIKTPDNVSTPAVISDLESAIALARAGRSEGPVSPMQAKVLRNAYGQLAAIYLQQSKMPENDFRSWQLQLKASDMMVQASNYGEQIAASLAASINPYAKLCGNMMETVLKHQ